MSSQTQLDINGTTIYHLMARPKARAIIGTTECICIIMVTQLDIINVFSSSSSY